MTTNYEKFYGSPEKINEQFNSRCFCCRNMNSTLGIEVDCNRCPMRLFPGFGGYGEYTQLEWLQEETE